MSSIAADFRPRKVCWIGLKASCSSYFASNQALMRAVASGGAAGCQAGSPCCARRRRAVAAAAVSRDMTRLCTTDGRREGGRDATGSANGVMVAGMTPDPSFQMLEMIAGGVVAQSVSVAAEIGIADMLAHGPRTTAQLAAHAAVDEGRLFRLLRFLASVGVF